ncbi:MAG: amino acid ABC transporter permease [Chlamydiales bacterium]|nr:amino acid ABC transporter permease [Chlamydiales bacterium]
MDAFDQSLIIKSLPLLLKGVQMTLQVFFATLCLSTLLGILFGTILSTRCRIRWLSSPIKVITFFLRAVPFYVQLLIVYFVLPDLLGINLDGFVASVIALGFCSSGYVAQTVRGGLNTIESGQWEASFTLGFSKIQTLRYIIFPQVFRNIIPALTNELESLLKSTSILSSIGMLELTRAGMNIISREMEPLTIYILVALFYAAISLILNMLSRHIEKRLAYTK